ncbi:MAG: ABC transporter permease [Actinomycetota bacterium]|nr:ABC transporter permease [Actinomycetota bacterium]
MTAFASALRRSPLLLAGLLIVSGLVAIAVLAPWIAPYDPEAITGDAFENPSSAHLLGTNDAGADIFSRLVMGSRTTLVVAGAATALILAIGVAVGLTAGLRGGFIDTALMRLVDVFLALPVLPLLIFIAALAEPSRTLSILMIGLFNWAQTARVVRSQTLSLRTRGFVGIARGFGAGPLYVIRRHLMPTLGPVIAANLVFVAGLAVTIEAGLAFIGLADPAAVSWGGELNRALFNPQIYLGSLWLSWLMPVGLAITLAVLGFTFIGIALEPRFNPRWSRAR